MNNTIGAVILAAGRGKRMNSEEVNKVTLRLHGKPLIQHTMDVLKNLHVSPIIVVIGFAKQSIKDVLKDTVIYAEQKEQVGTADALMCGIEKIPQNVFHVLVLNGDDSAFYTKDIIRKLIEQHIHTHASVSFLTMNTNEPESNGRILRDSEGKVKKIIEEKDATEQEKQIKEINIACYLFTASFLRKYLKEVKKSEITGEYYLTNLIEIAYNNNEKIETVTENNIKWRGINTPEELREAEKLF